MDLRIVFSYTYCHFLFFRIGMKPAGNRGKTGWDTAGKSVRFLGRFYLGRIIAPAPCREILFRFYIKNARIIVDPDVFL